MVEEIQDKSSLALNCKVDINVANTYNMNLAHMVIITLHTLHNTVNMRNNSLTYIRYLHTNVLIFYIDSEKILGIHYSSLLEI